MIIGPCTIVTGGERPAVVEDTGVRVVGAHIAQIGPVGNLAAAHPDETLWPARGRVLMPGLVNTHAHLARHLARGLGIRDPREWPRYERALSPEDVRWAATAALVEGLRHGVTTVCDFHRSGSPPDLTLSEIADAARATGARVAACYGAAESDPPEERRAAAEECRGFADDLATKREGRVCALVGARAETLGGVDRMLAEALETAADRLAVHVDLALDLTPADRWTAREPWRQGALPALWAHPDAAPPGLLAAARRRGDLLSLAAGPAPLAREADVAWGSDGGANAPPLPPPAHRWPLDAASGAHYRRLFVNGARWAARCFGERLGEIAPGAPADLVLADYSPATEFSSRTLGEHLEAGLLRAAVSGVMVAGEIVLDNGVIVTVDEREVAARARECARRVWKRLE